MWRDWVLVAVLVAAVLLEGLLRPEVPWRVLSLGLTLALIPLLLWRRSHPLVMVALVFLSCSLAGLLTSGEAPGLNTLMFVLLLPYALFRWGSGREAVLGVAVILLKIVQIVVTDGTAGGEALAAGAILTAAMATGGAFRYRAGSRARELEQVKLLERERLARDLHDTVAHHVSAIAIRAQAGLATAPHDRDAAADALRVIEDEASRTLAEMRAIVKVLRRDQPIELAPSPHVADLEGLAGRGEAGPSVDVHIAGNLDGLPPSVAAAVYRLAQESVTNARRHARHATRIEVRVTADEDEVRLRVNDDGDSSVARPNGANGYGLAGMTERATLLGGTCEAGPDPDRGWTVTAVLPRAGWAT